MYIKFLIYLSWSKNVSLGPKNVQHPKQDMQSGGLLIGPNRKLTKNTKRYWNEANHTPLERYGIKLQYCFRPQQILMTLRRPKMPKYSRVVWFKNLPSDLNFEEMFEGLRNWISQSVKHESCPKTCFISPCKPVLKFDKYTRNYP